MSNSERDDFRKSTKEELALRVGYLCSKPDCRRSTVGPKPSGDGFIRLGDAAHITAAAIGGPRYDSSLTVEERKSASNGIWLCKDHARLVDADEKFFTVEMLRKWRHEAEAQAFRALSTRQQSGDFLKVGVELDDDDQARIVRFALPATDNLEEVTRKVREASKEDILTFTGQRTWPAHTVELNLQSKDAVGTHSVDISGLAVAIPVAREVALVAAPGTGKTTTLVQVANAILASEPSVAVFVPLAEWSSGKDTIFQSLTHRNAFRHLREQHFMLLALHSRLILLLDGWNELDSYSKSRVIAELTALRRDYPLIGIVISTRRQNRDVPIVGPMLEIQPLSDEQQQEIAQAERGEHGARLIDQAWRTPGVRELISIPLYLNALLKTTPGGAMPQTKEEVLSFFVNEHEKQSGRAEILERELHGVHHEFLVALAIEATAATNTSITEDKARAVVSAAGDKLIAAGQIGSRPEPIRVLNTLVDQHILVRGADKSLSFQHQQFQEWYAAFEVERTLRAAVLGDEVSTKILAAEILNMPAWEESILFSCERLSRSKPDDANAVARAIVRTLSIDPILAGEMIYRSSADVWELVKDEVVKFALKWHDVGKVDRAANFMITTGRPEFSEQIWPLVSHANDQVQLSTMRVARRFRPSVLGSDIDARIAALPDGIRDNLLSEIASRSGYDGIEVAARIATIDPSPVVQSGVIEALLFRRADRIALEILRPAQDAVWTLLAQKGYDDEIDDVVVSERLKRERLSHIQKDTHPLRKLNNLLEHAERSPETASQIAEVIESDSFPVKDSDSSWRLKEALERYPEVVQQALIKRLESGRALPYRADELLRPLPPVDSEAISNLVLDTTHDNQLADMAAAIVGEKTVGKLIDALIAIDEKVRTTIPTGETARKEYWRINGRLSLTKPNAFYVALIKRSDTKSSRQISLLADLLARHGVRGEAMPLSVSPELKAQLMEVVQKWTEILLSSPDAKRHDFSEVVCVIERLPVPEFLDGLKRLLDEDLLRYRVAREKFLKNPVSGDQELGSEARTSYGTQYQRAFVAIGGDLAAKLIIPLLGELEFGVDAAIILKLIWDKQQNVPKKDFFRPSPDFSEVPQRRVQNSSGRRDSSPFAEAILSVVRQMSRPECDVPKHLHAVKLARIGLSMPHGDKDQLIGDLLSLSIPSGEKHELLTSLVLAGYVIGADLVLDGLRALVEEAKTQRWLLEDNFNRVGYRLALLPFSDRPKAVFDALDLVEVRFRDPWKLGGLLHSLGRSPDPESEAILVELAARDNRFYGHHDWVSALLGRRTATATKLVMDLIASGALPQGSQSYDGWRFGHELAALIREHPSLQLDLYQKYQQLSPGNNKSILEAAVAELATPEGFLVLVKEYAAMKRGFDGSLHRMLESIALGKEPVPGWRDAYELYSLDVTEIRKKLFAMLDSPEGAIAEECLIAIDELRDEHGRNDAEPRHPDIESGRPWPRLAA